MVSVAAPLITGALKNTRMVKFSGKAEDFPEFEKQWKAYLKILITQNNGNMVPDDIVLANLAGFLDAASADWLQARMEQDEELGYYDFFEDLRSRFARDARTIHRQAWELVKLVKRGTDPTLQEWNAYQAAYLKKRALVEDWADEEDRKMVFKQIPKKYRQRVINEVSKRSAGQYWVRVTVPHGLNAHDVQSGLEEDLEHPLRSFTMEKRGFVFRCASAAELKAVLKLDGSKFDGAPESQPLKFKPAQPTMSGD